MSKRKQLSEEALPDVPAAARDNDLALLQEASWQARRAIRESRQLDDQARQGRERARSKVIRYNNLVAEFNGQLTLFDGDAHEAGDRTTAGSHLRGDP